jgi:radical SAM protein with 4Fe4S-binding SPASM domain
MAEFYQKANLLKGLISGDIARTGPFYVAVDLTRRCNLQCPDCQYHSPFLDKQSSNDEHIKDIPVHSFEKLCSELKTMGTTSLILTGEGEPFLHPRMFDLISIAKRMGFNILLFTNGTLLNKSSIQLLLNSRLDVLKVSLWASSAEEYRKSYLTSKSDNFEKIVDGLKLLKDLKVKKNIKFPDVVLHQPITRQNFKNIKLRIALAEKTGCSTLSFSPTWSWRGVSTPSPDEMKQLYGLLNILKKRLDSSSLKHNINQTLLQYKIGEAVWEKLPCYIAWYHTRIRVNGNVLPCQRCDLPMGNINENSFNEIWNGSAYQSFRKKTVTRTGLASMGEYCDCRFCCYATDNLKVHRFFRWVSPFVSCFKK